jgi:type I restriction enzyme S subunit
MAFEISELLISRELPTGWSVGLVGDIAKVNATSISKKSPPEKIQYLDISSVGTRVFEKPKLLEYSEAPSRAQRVVKDGDTLISTVRPNLRAFAYISKADENLVASTGFACVTANNKNDSQYLHYFLTSEPFVQHLIRFADGAAYPAFDYKLIPVAEIPLPPASERKSIGQFLGAFDDRITLLRETNQTLEAIAQAIFKSWFVDFDPVRAKSQGLEPEGMNAETAAIFPDSFEESELGMRPKGWDVVALNEYCKIYKGCSYKGAGLSDNAGAYMLNLGCFNAPRVFAFENIKRYKGEYKERHRVSAGDLIVANTDVTQTRAILGRPLIVPNGLQDSFISHHVFRLQLLNSDEPSMRDFLFFTFQQSEFRKRAIGYATGTTVLALPKDVLEDFKLTRPSNEVLAAFNEVTDPLLDSIQENELKVDNLSKLRDALLPRLISGQLQIPDAEQAIEKATA